MAKLTIAIDGPAGSGKSTAAKRVAELLGYGYINTGAMYRAVALAALRAGTAPDEGEQVVALTRKARIELRWDEGRTRVWLDGAEVSEEIRRPEVAQAASLVSTIPAVRELLVARQRELGAGGGVVMEGRDIGSVVLPLADLKIFLTASAEVRARRRMDELAGRGERVSIERMTAEVAERDRRDTGRASSPLVAAEDAVIVDSTAMEREEVARVIVLLAREKEKRRGAGKPLPTPMA
jgi:cytidylate kinase